MITDPISDMLTRIKNGYMAKKAEVVLPFSKIKLAIANILKNSGFIFAVREEGDPTSPAGLRGASKKRELRITLLYRNDEPAIKDIKRVSKPGRRIYARALELPNVLSGYGTAIISTPKGIMTNKEARKQNVGGEIICEVY